MEGRESTESGSPTITETDSPPVNGFQKDPSSVSRVVPEVTNMAVNMSNIPAVGGGGATVAAGGGSGGGGCGGGEGGVRPYTGKKRGRPRKNSSEENVAFSISPQYFSPPSDFAAKRGRGRPPGSGNRQVLSTLGELVANSAGGNFTPHVVTINTGEDVAAKILSFSQNGPRAICILSANGSVSNVTIRQPGSSGGILTYEGRFEILSLSGSFTLADIGDGRTTRTGGLSVSLAGPDGRVIGGGVAGLLMAASPIQVVVGSFMPNCHKVRKRKYHYGPRGSPVPISANVITTARPISQAAPNEDASSPTSTLPEQNQGETENSTGSNQKPNCTSYQNAGWQATQTTTDQKPSPDINVCLPG